MTYIRSLTINGVKLTMMCQVFFLNASLFNTSPNTLHYSSRRQLAPSISEFNNSVEKRLVHLKQYALHYAGTNKNNDSNNLGKSKKIKSRNQTFT